MGTTNQTQDAALPPGATSWTPRSPRRWHRWPRPLSTHRSSPAVTGARCARTPTPTSPSWPASAHLSPMRLQMQSLSIRDDDGAEIRARWYTHGDECPGAAVVYAHGGGMIAGDLDVFD